jgi:mono/diheme cytochrome c family protein
MNPFPLTAIAFLLAVPVYGQAPQDAPLTTNPVYEQNCAKCHGKTGGGRTFAGPSLVSEKALSMSADDLRSTIANGKHRMPKFADKLSAAEVDLLVAQIRAQKKR